MVSIRKAKKGFRLRKRGHEGVIDWLSQYDKEKVGLVIISMTLGFLCVVAFVGVFNSNNTEESSSFLKLRRKSLLQLEDPIVHKPMSDAMNALAIDIYETLDCPQLFNTTLAKLEAADKHLDYDKQLKDNDVMERRRLEEVMQQHGDDAGFENVNLDQDNKAKNNNNVVEKENSSEDWGKDAQKVLEETTDDKWGKAARGGGKREDRDEYGDDKYAFGGEKNGMDDYDEGRDWGADSYTEMTGRHLFCLAASPNPPSKLVSEIRCDATQTKRKMLLDLWSAARAQISDTSTLKKALDVARERANDSIMGKFYNLWAPYEDEGIQFVLNTLNSDKDADNGGLLGLSESLGPGKLFVDIGSCLGLTTLAITAKYPGTQIASIEPASPNWLLQEMNLRCNLEHDEFQNIKLVLAGVGPNDSDEDNMMAKLMWRASSTTSTRAWTPENELQNQSDDDIELVVRLRKLKSILAEADVYGPHTINVLNVDCSGCEYNLIPALTDEEFDAIPTVLGGVHWGYIPTSKLPSSQRAKTTHERLCRHESVARTTKECCAFPDMAVQSSVPGEILVNDNDKGGLDKPSTVMDVIMDGLCDDFDTWAKKTHLFTVQDDWGWFELTSRASV
jgi:FkbM family methyltransferase